MLSLNWELPEVCQPEYAEMNYYFIDIFKLFETPLLDLTHISKRFHSLLR